MAPNQYSFTTHRHVPAPPELVSAILADATQLPRWWPSVYLDASFRLVDNQHPRGFSFEAWGDFEGTGVWSFAPEAAARTSAATGTSSPRSRCSSICRS